MLFAVTIAILMNIYSAFVLLVCLVSFLVCIWIVIPAPIFSLLPLSVGTPEISPWLVVINAISAIVLTLTIIQKQSGWAFRLALGLSVAALILSALPLAQYPQARRNANQVMATVLGNDSLNVPKINESKLRSKPFIFADVFRGIAPSLVRETLDLPFANPNGVTLMMNVYRPVDAGNYPAIVMIYGGAWQRGDPSQNVMFSRYMANQGYVVRSEERRVGKEC